MATPSVTTPGVPAAAGTTEVTTVYNVRSQPRVALIQFVGDHLAFCHESIKDFINGNGITIPPNQRKNYSTDAVGMPREGVPDDERVFKRAFLEIYLPQKLTSPAFLKEVKQTVVSLAGRGLVVSNPKDGCTSQ